MSPDYTWRGPLTRPLSLRDCYFLHGMGPFDPTVHRTDHLYARAVHTEAGPATFAVRLTEDEVTVEGWGPGAEALDGAALTGEHENLSGWNPEGRVRKMHGQHRGLRIVKMPDLMRLMAQTVLQQRITWKEAARNFNRLVAEFGEDAPGPVFGERPLRLPPQPKQWGHIALADYADCGVERSRAEAIRVVARSLRAFRAMCVLPPEEAQHKLQNFRGIGPWTVGNVLALGCGWTDAVVLQDFDLPHAMCWNLAGEERGSDERMLELLEPYRGQRWRVTKLVMLGGSRRPRFAPRRRTGRPPGRRRRR